MLQTPFKRFFITLLNMLLMLLLLMPGTAFAKSSDNPSHFTFKLTSSTLPSSDAFKLSWSFNLFGNSIPVLNINITREQAEQFEFLTEANECHNQFDPSGCANLIISLVQLNTTGLFHETIRLLKIFGNGFVCVDTIFREVAACFSVSQAMAREWMFGPPPLSHGTNDQTPLPSSPIYAGEAWTGSFSCLGTTCQDVTRSLTIRSIQPQGQNVSTFTGTLSLVVGSPDIVQGMVGDNLSEFTSEQQSLLQNVINSLGPTYGLYLAFSETRQDGSQGQYAAIEGINHDWVGEDALGGRFDIQRVS